MNRRKKGKNRKLFKKNHVPIINWDVLSPSLYLYLFFTAFIYIVRALILLKKKSHRPAHHFKLHLTKSRRTRSRKVKKRKVRSRRTISREVKIRQLKSWKYQCHLPDVKNRSSITPDTPFLTIKI